MLCSPLPFLLLRLLWLLGLQLLKCCQYQLDRDGQGRGEMGGER